MPRRSPKTTARRSTRAAQPPEGRKREPGTVLRPLLRDRARDGSAADLAVRVDGVAEVVRPGRLALERALSAICREVVSSSLIVVVISAMAVACSRSPVACWVAAACSSVDEVCTCVTAPPI